MDEKIFKLYYDNIKKEHKFTNVLKESSKLNQAMVIIYFILMFAFIAMVIIGCFYPIIVKFSWVPLLALVIPAFVITISTKRANGTTGTWGKGMNNKTTIPQDMLR